MIIGLSGLAGSGKTTVGNILVREHGFVRRPFAYPLKSMIAALGFDREVLDGPSAGKELPLELFGGRSLREAMQTLGTEWGRAQFGDDFWIKMWMRGLSALGSHVVADDVRFENEANAVRAAGGIVVRLNRSGAGARMGSAHSSELVDLIKADHVLSNDLPMEDLKRAVADLISADVRDRRVA